jgi:bifunctional DNA-binding transcriptional regulator/antitoxin component of YhaV-PrlF toxin-antitoxin module
VTVLKIDSKGRVLLSKELRKAGGVEKNDRLVAKPIGKGKILLERSPRHQKASNDPLDWLLSHPAKISSVVVKDKLKKIHDSRRLLESMKRELWVVD